jgi:hypothetical protein
MYWCLHGGTDTLKTYTEKAKQEFARRVVSAYQDMNKQKEEKK